MKARRRRSQEGLLLFSLAGLACAPEELVTTPGVYVDYRHSPELEPCAGNAGQVDAFVAYTASLVEISADDIPHILYTWLPYEELVKWTDGECKDSCALGRNAFSISPALNHELVHTLFYDKNGRPAPFLAEGAASALDPFYLTRYTIVEDRDPRPLLTAAQPSSLNYAVAGLFVAYLIQTRGAERFVALYSALSPPTTLADWRQAFTTIYQEDLDVLVETYLADTTCPADVSPLPAFECEAPALDAVDGVWAYQRTLSCDDEAVVGGFDSDDGMISGATLTVEVAGEYDIAFQTTSMLGSQARVGACDRCRWLANETTLLKDETERVLLEPGRYFITTRVFDTNDNDVLVTITPAQ